MHGAFELRLVGRDFPSLEAAHKAGIAWRNHLTIAFAHNFVGIKIGSIDKPIRGGFGTPYYESRSRRARDEPGLYIAKVGEPRSRLFVAEGYVMQGIYGLVTYTIPWITNSNYNITSQHLLAYRLVHAAYFEDNPEATFILLVTAIEVLLPRREEAPRDFADLIDVLKQKLDETTDIDDDLRQDVAEVLEDDKFDSIGRRGRQLVSCLGAEQFSGKKPKDYFHGRYKARSDLVHGSVDRLTEAQLAEEVLELRRFTLALLGMVVFGVRLPDFWTSETVQGLPR